MEGHTIAYDLIIVHESFLKMIEDNHIWLTESFFFFNNNNLEFMGSQKGISWGVVLATKKKINK